MHSSWRVGGWTWHLRLSPSSSSAAHAPPQYSDKLGTPLQLLATVPLNCCFWRVHLGGCGREGNIFLPPSSLPSKTLQGLQGDCYPKRIFSGSLTGRLRPSSVQDKSKPELELVRVFRVRFSSRGLVLDLTAKDRAEKRQERKEGSTPDPATQAPYSSPSWRRALYCCLSHRNTCSHLGSQAEKGRQGPCRMATVVPATLFLLLWTLPGKVLLRWAQWAWEGGACKH